MTPLSDTEFGQRLLLLARKAIAHELGLTDEAVQDDPALAGRAATFVTLKLDGDLRGCIGSVRAQRALSADVRENAIAAATRDPRFAPVTAEEFERLRIEVSLLSEPEFIEFADEDELIAKLRPGVDGVLLFSGCRSATFLPQVWEQLPDPRSFLAALKQKAGLDPARAAPNLMVAIYTVKKWAESDAYVEQGGHARSTT